MMAHPNNDTLILYKPCNICTTFIFSSLSAWGSCGFPTLISPETPKGLGCLPFVRINWLGRLVNNAKGFSKINKPAKQDGAYNLQFDYHNYFWLMRDWKLEILANGKENSAVPF